MKEVIMSNNLAVKLCSGTRQAHRDAENIGFMKCPIQGVIDRECFIKVLGDVYFVYSELQTAIDKNKQHPVIGVMYLPELDRQASPEKNMMFYHGNLWPHLISPLTATQNYIARIYEISAHEPTLLLGHAYTHYIGDISVGQMLQNIAQSALKLSGYERTSFYKFEQIPDKQEFKNRYRQALDTVAVDDITADKIIPEANDASYLNMEIMKELKSILIQALGRATYNDLV
jgi:heme oxygenase